MKPCPTSLGRVFEEEQPPVAGRHDTPDDEFLAQDGRVMDGMLSEHMCQGWLEGYLLTGRHGFFNSYEAFIRIVDSMVRPARQMAQGLRSSSPGGRISPP